MVKNTVEFKRVALAFDEVTSGSEHSAESLTDLSDLVNSFLERETFNNKVDYDDDDQEQDQLAEKQNDDDNEGDDQSKCCLENHQNKDGFKRLLSIGDDDFVKRKIHGEVEQACIELGCFLLPVAKRKLMTRLRDKGLNAGICKTKWEKKGGCTSGSYEFIDIIYDGSRYIIEVSLISEFEIARPTGSYTSLMNEFPPIYVGKVGELKRVVKLMCNSIRASMKVMNIYVPPWRRLAYMQAKWFGSYRRTISEIPYKKKTIDDPNYLDLGTKRSVGFVPVETISCYCREDLAVALSASSMLL